jgi:hypothetical protein
MFSNEDMGLLLHICLVLTDAGGFDFWVCVCVVVGFKLGVTLARQALYHLSHAPNPFCF